MKILIFNEFYYPYHIGGAEISTQLLAEGLVKAGHDVYVCTTCDVNQKQTINGVKVIYINIQNIYWPYKLINRGFFSKLIWHTIDIKNIFHTNSISHIIKEINPDIIHTNNLSGFSCIVWNIADKYNIPITHTLRDYYLLCIRCTMYNKSECNQCKICSLFSYYKRKASNYVNSIIGISSFILNKHLEHNYFKNTAIKNVIPNPVLYFSNKKHKDRPTKTIGYIGSISKSKGIEKLLKDFSRIASSKHKLVIAGDGNPSYVNELKHKYSSIKNISFIGKIKAELFFEQIDLLVVPSMWNEPFGRVVIEAICSNIPVIASNKGGIPEIIRNRHEAYLYNDNDENGLYDALSQYINGNIIFDFSNIDEFISRYSIENITNQYYKIYQLTISRDKKKNK